MLTEGRNEPLLVFCKAAGLSWLTLRALLQDDLLGRAASEDELNKLKSDYIRLSHSTAKKLLEFWCEHQTPQKP
jgi:DNA-binding transcriptional regulator YbjK